MTAYYVDSSALVKRYVNGTGSAWMRAICDPTAGHILALAHIGLVEVAAALGLKHRQGSLRAPLSVACCAICGTMAVTSIG